MIYMIQITNQKILFILPNLLLFKLRQSIFSLLVVVVPSNNKIMVPSGARLLLRNISPLEHLSWDVSMFHYKQTSSPQGRQTERDAIRNQDLLLWQGWAVQFRQFITSTDPDSQWELCADFVSVTLLHSPSNKTLFVFKMEFWSFLKSVSSGDCLIFEPVMMGSRQGIIRVW